MSDKTKQQVSDYYQNLLHGKTKLKTDSCCVLGDCYLEHAEILSEIHEDVLKKNYGCGSPIPPQLKGCTIVDLGSGAGRDVYLCSALVGDEGKVIGVDMTDDMIKFASQYKEYHKKKFNQKNDVVEFKKGYIEDLKSIGIEDNSVDVVISNCVINLSPDKQKVFNEIYRVLKQGGELYFSDVFADRRIPKHLQEDSVLWGECLAGALYIEDFRKMLQKAGFAEFRIVDTREIGDLQGITERLKEKNEGNLDIHFFSVTIRAVKLDSLEDTQEDYQQFVSLLGAEQFTLDIQNVFSKGQIRRVSGNTAEILRSTRYKSLFTVTDKGRHTGPFKTPSYYDLMNIGKKQEVKGGSCGGSCSGKTKGTCGKQKKQCSKGEAKQCCKAQTTGEQKSCCQKTGEQK